MSCERMKAILTPRLSRQGTTFQSVWAASQAQALALVSALERIREQNHLEEHRQSHLSVTKRHPFQKVFGTPSRPSQEWIPPLSP